MTAEIVFFVEMQAFTNDLFLVVYLPLNLSQNTATAVKRHINRGFYVCSEGFVFSMQD